MRFRETYSGRHYHGRTRDNRYLVVRSLWVDFAWDIWKSQHPKANAQEYREALDRYYSPDDWVEWARTHGDDFGTYDDFVEVGHDGKRFLASHYKDGKLINSLASPDFEVIHAALKELNAKLVISSVSSLVHGIWEVQS